jgi:hypothetical protein
VFHHFNDIESLREAGYNLQYERHWSRLRPVDCRRTVEERINAVLRQRRRLFEAISPTRRAAYAKVVGSPTLAVAVANGRAALRDQLAATFDPEIERAGETGPDLLDALDTVAGWEAWDALRWRSGRSVTATERVMRLSMHALLATA